MYFRVTAHYSNYNKYFYANLFSQEVFLVPTKNKVLTAAVLLACSCLLAPYYAHAEEEDIPDCGHDQHYMDINIDSATPSSYTYTFDIYTASTHPGPHWRGEYQLDDNDEYILDANGEKIKVYASYRDFFPGEEQALWFHFP